MITRNQLTAILAIAVVLWGALLIINGVVVTLDFLKPFSWVLGALVIIISAFDKWLWRLPFLHRWLVSVPDLNGTWKGEIVSFWKDPKTGQQKPPIEAYMIIKQAFTSLVSIDMFTQDAGSKLVSGKIVRESDGVYVITEIYHSVPELCFRNGGSPIHYGGMILRVDEEMPVSLKGHYWTDRDTKGELCFKQRCRKIYGSFESARRGTYI